MTMLSGLTTPYTKGHRRNIQSHGLKCTVLCRTTLDTLQVSHLTIILLNKPMVYGVVHQVYGVVSSDSVVTLLMFVKMGVRKT